MLAFGTLGSMVPGPLQTRYVPPDRALMHLGVDSGGMLGITLMIAATIVIACILFGQILLASGAGRFFNDLALGPMGRRRDGSAKIAIVGSGLFGPMSGVVVSNIVAAGVITIRIMIRDGYRRTTAAGIEAVASTGGQILPPIMGAVVGAPHFLPGLFVHLAGGFDGARRRLPDRVARRRRPVRIAPRERAITTVPFNASHRDQL